MLAAGYDGLSAGALILLGAGIGCLGSTVNPFATGIASGFAGTNISEGLIGRVVLLVVGTILGIWFVMRYAEKVKKDPSKSLIYDMKAENEKQFLSSKGEGTDFGKFTTRHKVILVLFFLAFVVMVYGVIPWEDLGIAVPTWWWWFPEMTAELPVLRHPDRHHRPAVGKDAGGYLCRWRPGYAGCGADHRRGARDYRNYDQRFDYRYGAVLGGTGGFRVRRGGIHHRHLHSIPAAVVPDPLQLWAGDGLHADHGSAGCVRRGARVPGGHGLPGCQRVGQPDHADLGGSDGRVWPLPGSVMAVWLKFVAVLLALLFILTIIVLAGGVLVG